MMKEVSTGYFDGEGRGFMRDCLHRSVEWCVGERIDTLVIFTGTGEGPHYAGKELLPRQGYQHLRAVAVTPPVGRPYRQIPGDTNSPLIRAGINPAMRSELNALGISVVSAHLPFKESYNGKDRSSEWTRVAEAYGVLGGGFALCIQAVLVACDAGAIQHGERVVALSADTAFVVTACRTESFLSPTEGLLIGHIICRPGRYSISKRLHETIAAPPPPHMPPPPQLPRVAPTEPDEPKGKLVADESPVEPTTPALGGDVIKASKTVMKPKRRPKSS